MILPAFIPSPSSNGFHLGPFFFHAYGLAYVFAVAAAIFISARLWARQGGDPTLASRVAVWAFPGGLIGGRIYFLITTPSQVPPHWWGPFAIWSGGLGIWGGVAGGAAVGIWRARRELDREQMRRFADCVAPGVLVAQAIGRIGNYFNQELFGKPTKLPWGLKIDAAHRPPGYERFATFQPTFLYEMIFDLAWAGFLIWIGHFVRRVRAPGLWGLYVAGYSAFRLFEETLRIDYSNYVLGMRLNFWIALLLCVAGLAWFAWVQWGRPARGRAAAEVAPAPPARRERVGSGRT